LKKINWEGALSHHKTSIPEGRELLQPPPRTFVAQTLPPFQNPIDTPLINGLRAFPFSD